MTWFQLCKNLMWIIYQWPSLPTPFSMCNYEQASSTFLLMFTFGDLVILNKKEVAKENYEIFWLELHFFMLYLTNYVLILPLGSFCILSNMCSCEVYWKNILVLSSVDFFTVRKTLLWNHQPVGPRFSSLVHMCYKSVAYKRSCWETQSPYELF